MKVYLSSHLRHYTNGQGEVEASGRTLARLMEDLDRQYPGLKFRIIDEQEQVRQHINVFVNADSTRDLATALSAKDEVHVLAALSGG